MTKTTKELELELADYMGRYQRLVEAFTRVVEELAKLKKGGKN